MKVIMECVNIKLWDILGCFHYILNAPHSCDNNTSKTDFFISACSVGKNIKFLLKETKSATMNIFHFFYFLFKSFVIVG